MKFRLKTGEVAEGRPNSEEKPACIIFNILDEKGREFNYTYTLPKIRFQPAEIDVELEKITTTFKVWAGKKLTVQEPIESIDPELECMIKNERSTPRRRSSHSLHAWRPDSRREV